MFLRGALDAVTGREKLCGTAATPEAIAGLFRPDSAKALVMAYINQLVADGYAEWEMLDDKDVRLCFHTGETFRVAETVITRIA